MNGVCHICLVVFCWMVGRRICFYSSLPPFFSVNNIIYSGSQVVCEWEKLGVVSQGDLGRSKTFTPVFVPCSGGEM